jgi:cell division protease FtsH
MGGRVAEELTQDDITTGAGNDIERATEMARRMVCEWGMSKLGPLSFGGKDEPVFLGRDFAQRAAYSEDTAIRIDREVERIVQSAYQRARTILTDHRDVLERLSIELLEQEVLDGKFVYKLVEEVTGDDLTPVRAKGPGDGMDITPEGPGRAISESPEEGDGSGGSSGDGAAEPAAAADDGEGEAEEKTAVAAAHRRATPPEPTS